MTSKLPHSPLDCISRVRFASFANGVGNNHLLVSSWDAHVRLYDVTTASLIGLRKHNYAVLDCTFMHDASRFLSVGLEKRLVAFDFQSQQETTVGQHSQAIRCVEFHPGTQQIFTGSWDRTVCAWDPRQPQSPVQMVNVGAKVFALDVNADKVFVAGSDRCIHMYDVRRLGALLEKRESSLKHQIRAVKASIDQKTFVSSSVEGRVAIEHINPADNERSCYAFKCHRVKEDSGTETVHAINALAYHPVHGTFATGGSDGGVCVWDGNAKKRLWRLNPFETSVSSLCFSADGSQLAIGVSYTFDNGEVVPAPATELAIRQITDSEVRPKEPRERR